MVKLKCIFKIEIAGCICCVPSDFTKEGDADERDGSINVAACYLYGIVIHRQ